MNWTQKLEQLNAQRGTLQSSLDAALDARNASEIARITPELQQLDKDIAACKSKLNMFAVDAELGELNAELGVATGRLLEAAPKSDDLEALKSADFELITTLQSNVKEIEGKISLRKALLAKIADDGELKRLEVLLQNAKANMEVAVEAEDCATVKILADSIDAIKNDIKLRKAALGADEEVADVDDTEDTDDSDTDDTDTADDDDDEYVPLS